MKKAALFTMMLMAAGAAAAQVVAGTQITNQATAQYQDSDGTAQLVESNTVVSIVQEVCGVSVVANGTVDAPAYQRSVMAGDEVALPYTLTNTGNFAQAIPVTAALESVSSAQAGLTVYLDANGNGVVDSADREVTAVDLQPGASAALLVVARVAGTAEAGTSAYVNLIATCVAGDGEDRNNVSQIVVGAPPELAVEKAFSEERLRPGQQTDVRVTATNAGDRESREVILTDPLDTQVARGLEYVAGSARTNVGRIEFYDGNLWSASDTGRVLGIRVVVPRLAPGERAELHFTMRAQEAADGETFENVATARTGGRSVSASDTLAVNYTPAVAIGPVGQPLAEEGTEADTQTKAFAAVGQEVCFEHTLRNTGDVGDFFSVTVTYPAGQATHTLYGADNEALTQPIWLAPGEETLVRVCYVPAAQQPVDALVTVTGERGSTNATRDILRPLPQLTKVVVSPDTEQALVEVGDTVTYRLTVTNTYGRALTGVVISDPLPSQLDYISSVPSGRVDGQPGAQTVVWELPVLPAGETRVFEVTARVTDRALMGETITNTFNLVSTELPGVNGTPAVVSPPADVHIPIKIQVRKVADKRQATVGDRITFTLSITNPSPVADLKDVEVLDIPADASAFDYITGSTLVDGEPFMDPIVETRTLERPVGTFPAGAAAPEAMTWTLPLLKAGQTIKLSYDMRVQPGAVNQANLANFVEVTGEGPGGASDIARDNSEENVTVNLELFKPMGDLLGVVYVDRNRDGIYTKGLDMPINRARVALAGGRIAVTDADGRYAFMNVPLGTHAVRLDPATTPYPPLVMPKEGGLYGTQTVHVTGLTSADFPLAPLAGDIDVIRRTTLDAGALKVHKVVFGTPDGYVVNLHLNSSVSLRNVHLVDPLPEGARLTAGTAGYQGNLPAGERVISYSFAFDGEPRAAVTDPVVDWR